jgi:hypothetical protein
MLDSSPPRDRYSRRALFGSGFGRALHAQLVSFDDTRPWRGRAARAAGPAGSGDFSPAVPGGRLPAGPPAVADGDGSQVRPASSR